MTCSARLPVYALIIGAFIPNTTVAGVFNLQGLVLFVLYDADWWRVGAPGKPQQDRVAGRRGVAHDAVIRSATAKFQSVPASSSTATAE